MLDFTPFNRSAVGFDRIFRLLDEATNTEQTSYPPYNIERLGENDYRITVALAGFTADDVVIETKGNTLTITGKKADRKDTTTEFLHQGIAARGFERRFHLADHVEVKAADMENGLLHIALKRELPEALKPRHIPINGKAKLHAIDATAA